MKIYTRTGDTGQTGLIGGQRVNKSDPRLESYGTVDELNAALGLAASQAADQEPLSDLVTSLLTIQSELLTVGSNLAALTDQRMTVSKIPALGAASIDRLEAEIDQLSQELPELRNFILPGGTELAASLHLSRTICRRAERLAVALLTSYPVDELIIRYLNRLSDLLFTMARVANHRAGQAEQLWQPNAGVID